MFAAVQEAANGLGVSLRVDANGGWDLAGAQYMMAWLKERGCDYVEQPLHYDADEDLPALFADRALPVFIDESCNLSSDVARLAHCVDGVNLKLMKCGGITEALRIVSTARAFGLKTMIGCMGESSVSIAAGASIPIFNMWPAWWPVERRAPAIAGHRLALRRRRLGCARLPRHADRTSGFF